MPTARLTVDAVLKMAHAQARRYAALTPAGQGISPDLREAIGQVWELVRQRLGHSRQVLALDEVIAKITGISPADVDIPGR